MTIQMGRTDPNRVVPCPARGCGWSGRFGDFHEHAQECAARPPRLTKIGHNHRYDGRRSQMQNGCPVCDAWWDQEEAQL